VVTQKNAVLWDVTQFGSCENRRFGGTYRLHHQGDKNRRARKPFAVISHQSMLQRENNFPSLPILVTLMMEVILSSETWVLKRATRHSIPEDDILHSHCRENLKILHRINWLSSVVYK
jgi:hypothetical protein